MSKLIIVGGGIIGLSSAYYAVKSGWDVTVIDKGDFLDNCSYGNCGYICPSHFIPLATPGVVKQGLKWMWNSKSPFYVQPRFDINLIRWGLQFMRSATNSKVEAAAIPLRDIALLSQQEYRLWQSVDQFDFSYEHKGLLEIFQTDAGRHHATHTVEKARQLGLDGTRLLDRDELQSMEPQTRLEAQGAIYFDCDAHCYPNRLMQTLIRWLAAHNVQLVPHEELVRVTTSRDGSISNAGFRHTIDQIERVHHADAWVIATGSWSQAVAKLFHTRLPLMPGRGYSVTLENSPYQVNHPAVLLEGRAAITPMDGNKIRFGGTMEITSHRTPPRMNRVQGILDAVKRYYPDFDVPLPKAGDTWYGYRPCSADGLPYIGRLRTHSNVIVATGHSMLGLSLGAGTGKLVHELLQEQPLSMDISPFRVERFG